MATYKSDGLRISTYTNGDTAIVAYRTAGSFEGNSTTITPGKPEVNKPDAASLSAPWSYEEPQPNIEKGYGQDGLPYIFKCEGLKKTTGGTATYTWLEPTLYKAWNNMGIDATEYAQFVEQTYYFTSDALAWIKPDGEESAKLYIKASEILVNDTNKQKLFEAGGNKVYIAGWDIDSYGIFKETTMENKDYLIIINSNTYTAENGIPYNPVFGIYNRTDNKWPFLVRSDGTLEASKGFISNWAITEKSLTNYSGTKDADGYYSQSFCMETPNEDGIRVLAIGRCSETDWGKADFYVTKDGELHAKNAVINGSITSSDEDSGIMTLSNGKLKFQSKNNYSNISLGSVGINIVDSSSYNASSLYLYTNEILFNYAYHQESGSVSMVTGPYIYHNGAGTAQFRGNWVDRSGNAIASDRNEKHSIEYLDERYEVFFDSLCSRRFKYNSGTSNRYHTGFITQEIQSGLQDANILESEFAGIITFDNGTEAEILGQQTSSALRYYEFIALNTWQIQLLKPRMTAAEEKIAQLELEISSLKSELANLKKS